MAIRTLLIDDEPNNTASLHFLLEKYCPDIAVVGTAGDMQEGVDLIRQTSPDLVFLDIEMPYGNGFDLLNKVTPVEFAVVFITAFDAYAIQAIKYAAMDYLLKPVHIAELKSAVEKVTRYFEQKKQTTQISTLLHNLGTPAAGAKKIGLPTQDGLVFENLENITHLVASSNYTIISTADKNKYTIAKTLREFEDMLPPAIFCRIHHSYLININYVKKYLKGRGGFVEMEDGSSFEVSARKKDEFLAKFS
jgi:two-component system, LytTR family, response regulator